MSLPTILTATYTGPGRGKSHQKHPISLAPSTFSRTAPFEDDERWKLFITTNNKVWVWDRGGCNPVFTSGSEGIVAARGARDGSVLAIADAQVVILHKIVEGQNKSYRLKGAQRCRLLQYDHESRSLFFTDSMHNGVQIYSLRENRVGDAAKSHPSPVVAFAMSCDSNLILSCSADPPIVQVHNRTLATTTPLTPRASSAPVNVCVFHPSRRNVFALAFNDGVLAAYDYSKMTGATGAKRDGKIGVGHGGLKEIHSFRHLHDPSIAGSSGITGLQFLPGYRSRAVTVGEDGRAFLVDFDMRDTLGSWHIGAPATGLAVRSRSGDQDNSNGYLIAVGAIHGRCYVYDGHGNKIGEQIADTEGGKVVGVEWVAEETRHPMEGTSAARDPRLRLQTKPHASSSPVEPARRRSEASKPKPRNSPSTENLNPSQPNTHASMAGPSTARAPRSVLGADEKLSPVAETRWGDVKETANQGYMRLFSPVKKKRPARASSVDGRKGSSSKVEPESNPQIPALQLESQRSAISAPPLRNEAGKRSAQKPLGQAKEGDNSFEQRERTLHSPAIAVRRAASGPLRDLPISDKVSDGKLLSDIRSVRAKVMGGGGGGEGSSSKSVRGNLAIFAPYMPSKGRKGTPKSPDTIVGTPTSPKERVDGSGDEGRRDPLQKVEEEQEQDSANASFGEDIWLVEGKETRRNRKRKQSTPDDTNETSFDPSACAIGSKRIVNNGSNSGSLKSRKTVSWGDEPGGAGTPDERTLPEIITTSVPGPSAPRDQIPTASSSRSPEILRTPSQQPAQGLGLKPSQTYLSTSSSFDNPSFHTAGGEEEDVRAIGSAEFNSAMRGMATDMRIAFRAEMEELCAEIGNRFRSQDVLIRNLIDEVKMVRRENEELRSLLLRK